VNIYRCCQKCGVNTYSADEGKNWYHETTYCKDCNKKEAVK